MNQQILNTSAVRAEQAASAKLQTLKLGLDIHAESIVVARILEHSAPQPAQTLSLPGFRAWVKTQLALAQEVHSCYEAGPFGYGLHCELVNMGINHVVVQPSAWTSSTRASIMTRATPRNWQPTLDPCSVGTVRNERGATVSLLAVS